MLLVLLALLEFTFKSAYEKQKEKSHKGTNIRPQRLAITLDRSMHLPKGNAVDHKVDLCDSVQASVLHGDSAGSAIRILNVPLSPKQSFIMG